jgi:uncharacterized protein with HEPN domain
LSNDLIVSHSDIEWRSMAGMRDRLIHGYFSVDYSIVWDVAVAKLPTLKKKIEDLIDRYSLLDNAEHVLGDSSEL